MRKITSDTHQVGHGSTLIIPSRVLSGLISGRGTCKSAKIGARALVTVPTESPMGPVVLPTTPARVLRMGQHARSICGLGEALTRPARPMRAKAVVEKKRIVELILRSSVVRRSNC